MNGNHGGNHRLRLQRIARQAMLDRDLCPDFSDRALAELGRIQGPAVPAGGAARDLRNLPWCSIDNDDSRDLDQLTAAEALPEGEVRALVAVADVEALVRRRSALDEHAHCNTTSVYTAGAVFPMFPDRLSTDLTSLGQGEDRLAVVVAMRFGRDGALRDSEIRPALVHNGAKLAYSSVAAWLDGNGPIPAGVAAAPGLEANLRLQDALAQQLKQRRHRSGALDLETTETRPLFEGDRLFDLEPETRNRAKELIEEFMIAANSATARLFASRRLPSIRRVVRTPRNWPRIVELAAEQGAVLPPGPSGPALERFLAGARAAAPDRFPDLSLSIIKLLGPGEYVLDGEGAEAGGHFGLAVRDYAHSTAPNRRYPDLITQRLLKAALAGLPAPYSVSELNALARRCTEREDAAKKVERQVAKSAAALLLEGRIGERFDAMVTGAGEKGTWVRVRSPTVEGRLIAGFERALVGARLRVELASVDVERGHIDFKAER